MFGWLDLLRNRSKREELARATEATEAGEREVKDLTRELRDLDRENHIVAKVHAAFRGE